MLFQECINGMLVLEVCGLMLLSYAVDMHKCCPWG